MYKLLISSQSKGAISLFLWNHHVGEKAGAYLRVHKNACVYISAPPVYFLRLLTLIFKEKILLIYYVRINSLLPENFFMLFCRLLIFFKINFF